MNALAHGNFGRESTPETVLEGADFSTHIGAGDEFTGEFKVSKGIRVSGTINGSITSAGGLIYIEKGAHVTGSVTGTDAIIIDGKVGSDGGSDQVKVSTPGLLVLQNDANVTADIEWGKLSTYGDMSHNGHSKKISGKNY